MPLKTFSEFIWKHVFNNFTAKVMALALALGLWLYAWVFSYTPVSEVEVSVRVHVAQGEKPYSVVNGENLKVKVKVSYPRRFEDQFTQDLRAQPPKTYFDCTVAPTPDQSPVTVTLRKELLVTSRDLFNSLRIDSFNPSELHIQLIRETASMVTVIPKTGAPPPGYRVEYAFPLTAAVMIRGQEDVIAQLIKTGIETEDIDISSPPPANKEEWDWQASAHIPSSITIGGKRSPISCADDQIQCHIYLTRESVEKNFTAVPIELLVPPAYSCVATPVPERTANVQVTGPKSVVDALKKERIILYVDVRDPKLVPQETPYTQPLYAQIVDEHQQPVVIAGLVVKPAVPTCAIKISEAKPK